MRDRIQKLYNKYLLKNISREEYDELFDLIHDDKNLHLVEEIIDEMLPQEITSSKEGQLVHQKPDIDVESKLKTTRVIFRRIIYRVSAAAAILLLIATMFLVFKNQSPDWIVERTGFQETKDVKLSDGSTVILNANSELKWKRGFEKGSERSVEFKGEAFFDVAHLDGNHFVVKTGTIEVNVLGTEFNLETRRDRTNIFLKEGKVLLKGQDMEPIEMVPGDLVHYDAKQKKVDKVSEQEADPALSWKDGVFTFLEFTGIEILEKMEDIYGKEFIISEPGNLNDVIVVQGLPYTDWNFTREALELALGVKFIDSTANKITVKIK